MRFNDLYRATVYLEPQILATRYRYCAGVFTVEKSKNFVIFNTVSLSTFNGTTGLENMTPNCNFSPTSSICATYQVRNNTLKSTTDRLI